MWNSLASSHENSEVNSYTTGGEPQTTRLRKWREECPLRGRLQRESTGLSSILASRQAEGKRGSHGLEGSRPAWSSWGINSESSQAWDSLPGEWGEEEKPTVTLGKEFCKLFYFIIEETESIGRANRLLKVKQLALSIKAKMGIRVCLIQKWVSQPLC